ncbi:MAG TPA: DUF721 domain-containing protein [Egibacteraceae bacterium]|nr:DUF721 domain-containing protein [Egibacteraceae bacterium]
MTWPDSWESPDGGPERPAPPVLGDLVARLTSSRRWSERLRGARIHQCWEEIAGAQLAAHVRPVRLAGGVLVVQAESPAWATQVRYLSAQLQTRANEVLGDGEVQTVKVQAGTGR